MRGEFNVLNLSVVMSSAPPSAFDAAGARQFSAFSESPCCLLFGPRRFQSWAVDVGQRRQYEHSFALVRESGFFCAETTTFRRVPSFGQGPKNVFEIGRAHV